MTQAYQKQAQQHSQHPQSQQTFLDRLFETRRIVNIAIFASGLGMLILLILSYVLKGKTSVIHIGILAVLLMLLLIALVFMVLDDPECNYDYKKIEDGHGNKFQIEELQQEKYKDGHTDQDSGSQSSSICQVIPRPPTRESKTQASDVNSQLRDKSENGKNQQVVDLQNKQN